MIVLLIVILSILAYCAVGVVVGLAWRLIVVQESSSRTKDDELAVIGYGFAAFGPLTLWVVLPIGLGYVVKIVAQGRFRWRM